MIETSRFMHEKWYSHYDSLIHTIRNKDRIEAIEVYTYEYLLHYYYPILHKIQIIDTSNGEDLIKKY